MKHRQATAQVETEAEVDDTEDQREAAQAADAPKQDNPLAKFDAPTLKGMMTSAVAGSGMSAFLPASMGEAMELAKLMAASNFVPPHLRGKPGDCLAIVLQSIRWRADAYAVASKTYFVSDRMAYEAQLVNAIVNTSTVLDGRLQITWQGNGPTLQCTVKGRIKGDDEVHELIQEIATITTRNSPLWKSSPRVQLGYYTTRSWARLFTPEVLMGIYTPDELEEARDVTDPKPGTQQVIPPRPTRESVKAQRERAAADEAAQASHMRETMRETPAHDAETGEVEQADEPEPESQPEPTKSEPEQQQDPVKVGKSMIKALMNAGDMAAVDKFVDDMDATLAWLEKANAAEYSKVNQALEGKRLAFKSKK